MKDVHKFLLSRKIGRKSFPNVDHGIVLFEQQEGPTADMK